MNLTNTNNIIDILEDKLVDNGLLDILLCDRTTGKNIIWATDNYEKMSEGTERYKSTLPITIDKIKRLKNQIKPRCIRAIEEQKQRTKDKAEVFTPSWICNKQNNSVDNQYDIYFNTEIEKGWENDRVDFSKATIDWRDYIKLTRIEITCGEAPYLVSRYDTVSGNYIKPDMNRIFIWDVICTILAILIGISFWIGLVSLCNFTSSMNNKILEILLYFAYPFIFLIVFTFLFGIASMIREKFIGKDDDLLKEQNKVLEEDWEEAIKINNAYNYVAGYKQDKETLVESKKLLAEVGIRV